MNSQEVGELQQMFSNEMNQIYEEEEKQGNDLFIREKP